MTSRIDPGAAVAALTGCDVGSLDLAGAVGVTRRIRELRSWVDWFETQITTRIDALNTAGSGAPAEEVHAGAQNMSAAEARKRKARAEAAAAAPSFGDALGAGEVTAEHVDVLAGVTGRLDDAVKDRVFEREQELLDAAKSMTPEEFRRKCRTTVSHAQRDEGVERAERQRRETRLSHRIDTDGLHHLHGVFHPELGAAIWHAISRHTDTMIHTEQTDSVDRQQVAAYALGELVIGGHQQRRPVEAEILVLIDHDTLLDGVHEHSVCEYDDTIPLPPESVRRMICNGTMIPIILGANGVPLNMGRHIRLANRDQRRALRTMYPTCAIPTCDTPFARCEIHHIVEYTHGGMTDLDNMIPLCARHHHHVHEHGWQLHLDPDRTLTLTITRADGTHHTTTRLPDLPKRRQTHRRRQRDQLHEHIRQRLHHLPRPTTHTTHTTT